MVEDVFSRVFPNDLVDERAEDLRNDITEKPPMKKSKTEELNKILCQTENQHFDYL